MVFLRTLDIILLALQYSSFAILTFQVHPDIVTLLCRICPELLEDLFDGMLWHSAVVEDDLVRVNYYVRELMGGPEAYPDSWDTPFGVLALNGPTGIFEHPLVIKVLCYLY